MSGGAVTETSWFGRHRISLTAARAFVHNRFFHQWEFARVKLPAPFLDHTSISEAFDWHASQDKRPLYNICASGDPQFRCIAIDTRKKFSAVAGYEGQEPINRLQ